MAKKRGSLSSPLSSGFPTSKASTRSEDAVIVQHKEYIGIVDKVTPDILSSAMGGQRRTTGVRESPNSTLGCEQKK